MSPSLRICYGAAIALACAAATARAQRTLGPGEDAWNLPGGVLRFGFGSKFFAATDRFGLGGRESLGAPYNGTVSAATFASLTSLDSQIGALTGDGSFHATLGVSRVNIQQSGATIPFSFSLGIMRRLTLHATIPLITGTTDAQWLLDGSTASVGANPQASSTTVLPQNLAVVTGLDAAATNLETLADGCAASAASDPRCAQIIGEMSAVRGLITDARTVRDNVANTYGGVDGTAPSLFVPLIGSAAEAAVLARLEALRQSFTRYATPSIADGVAPVGAGAPPTLTQLQALLADSVYGYALGPIKRRYSQGLGDVEVGATLTLFDGLGTSDAWVRDTSARRGFRETVGFAYRTANGTPPDPDDPLRIATGTGAPSLTFSSATDIVLNRNLWGSAIVRWTKSQSYDAIARIPDGSGSPFIPLARRRNATTSLGQQLQVSAMPRWMLNDAFAAGVRYTITHVAATTVTELAPFTDNVPLSYTGPAFTAHELGVGFSWSSVAAWHAGQAKWPIEVEYERALTAFGSGNAPRMVTDRFSLRAYARLWGK